jgi:replicative DNA helicase
MKQLNVEAEWMALHALTCSPNPIVRGHLFAKLKSGHFKYEVTHPLFMAIAEIAVQTGSTPSIQTLYATPGVSPVAIQSLGGYASTHQPITTEEDAKHVLHILDSYRKARLVFETTSLTLSEMEGENADLEKVKQNTERLLLGLSESEDEAPLWHFGENGNSDDLFSRVMNTEREPGIMTGFKNFDDKSHGYKRGNFVALASHFKGGKSITAYRMGLNQYELGYNVLYLPFEMSDEETTERHLASISGVDSSKIRAGTCSTFELKEITRAYGEFNARSKVAKNRFSIQALPTLSPSALVARFKAFKYDVIYCDYVNLMEPTSSGSGKMSDPERILVGLTQLDDKTGDLRYSKALKEHCNNVWTWMYKEAERTTGVIEVSQMAARSWEPFTFRLKVDYARSMVSDAPDAGESMASDWNSEPKKMEGMFNDGW